MKFVLLGALIISFAPICIRFLSSYGAGTIGGTRNLFGGLLLLVAFKCFNRESIKSIPKWPIFLAGLFFAIDMYLWNSSVKMIGVGLPTLLANTQVFYMALYGKIFQRESLSPNYYLGLIMSIIGVSLISLGGSGLSNLGENASLGIIMSLLAGFFYATTMILYTRASKTLSLNSKNIKNSVPLLWGSVSTITGILLMIPATTETFHMPTSSEWPAFFANVIIIHALAWYLIATHLPKIPISITGIVLLTQPAFSLLWGHLIFSESYQMEQLVGIVVTFLGIAMALLKTNKGRQKQTGQ